MQFLKADTAVKVVIGPVVAVGDGFTPVTTLSLSTADEAELIKHDAAAVTSISTNTFAAITSADGYYNLTLTAAQLDTEGMLTVLVNDDSLCLPVKKDFMVVAANVYDSLFAASGTDLLQVDLVEMGGATQSATDLKDFADAGYDPATNKVEGVKLVDTTTTNTDMVAAAPTAAANADAVWDELQSAHTTAGSFGEIATEIANILADTNELQTDDVPGLIAALNDISIADVNAQVLDVLNTDTFAEPTGVPGATVTLATKIGFLYMALRNQVTVTATKKTFYDDGGLAEWEKDLSDDGTTYTETEANAI